MPYPMYGKIYLARPTESCNLLNDDSTLDENDCQVAAESIPFAAYNGNMHNHNFPKGCFLYGNRGVKVYWNTHAVGMEDKHSRRICRAGIPILIPSCFNLRK